MIWVLLYVLLFGLLFFGLLKVSKKIPSQKVLFVSFFLFFWILPIFLQGTLKVTYKGLPLTFTDWHRVACLFTHKMTNWTYYYPQVLYANDSEWKTVNDRPYFQMEPFGYRTRFDRLVTRYRRKADKQRINELFIWLKQKIEKTNPDQPPIRSMRLVRNSVLVGEWKWKRRWEKPALSELPNKRTVVAYTYHFAGESNVKKE